MSQLSTLDSINPYARKKVIDLFTVRDGNDRTVQTDPSISLQISYETNNDRLKQEREV